MRLNADTTILSGQLGEVPGKRAEEHGASLVTMGTHGHSRIHAFVQGLKKSEILRSCKAPVVVMR